MEKKKKKQASDPVPDNMPVKGSKRFRDAELSSGEKRIIDEEGIAEIIKVLNVQDLQARKKRHILTIFRMLTRGTTLTEACSRVGLSLSGFCLIRRKNPSVQKAYDMIEEAQISAVEDALYRDVTRTENVAAKVFYLTNRCPQRWQDRRYITKEENVNLNLILSKPKADNRKKVIDIKESQLAPALNPVRQGSSRNDYIKTSVSTVTVTTPDTHSIPEKDTQL